MDFDLFKPKAPPLFGLDISSSSVKMLEIVEAGRGAYRVEHYAIEPLIRDTVVDGNISNLEQAADAVKRAHKRLGTRTRHVAMAVPTGAVITKKIVVAAGLREDELEVQVESEANQYIPFALEEVNLDFQSLGPTASNPDEQEVLIAATRKEKVEDRVAVAHLAGLKPLVMDVESFAQQAALSLRVQAGRRMRLAGGSAVIPGRREVVNLRTPVRSSVANPCAAMQTSSKVQLKRLMIDAPSLVVACGLAMRRFDPQ